MLALVFLHQLQEAVPAHDIVVISLCILFVEPVTDPQFIAVMLPAFQRLKEVAIIIVLIISAQRKEPADARAVRVNAAAPVRIYAGNLDVGCKESEVCLVLDTDRSGIQNDT